MTIEYIDKPEQLAELCNKISQESWIALDTEFIREKTYYPVFCLLQIATPEWVVCVDPIALPELSELLKVINNPEITKVFHSSRQDLEILYQLTGEVTYPVFDTQIAAPLLGFQENPGYAMLVSNLLNINLSKAHTRTDWTARPLSEAQINYAADDVIYLCMVYKKMYQKLEELGRLSWLEKDFEQLKNQELYQMPPKNAWLKMKGRNRLTGKQLSIIQKLAEWREKTAQSENRPKNWLIRDDLLLELAKLQPESVNELAKIRNLNERVVRRYGKKICSLINEAKLNPPIPLDEKAKSTKKSKKQEAILDVLSAVVRKRADENALNPMILADRKVLEKMLHEDEDNPLLQGWRYSMVGKELQGLLKGQYTITLNSDDLLIIEN